ncbi:MAG: hypothetical protein V3U27_06560 [Candidatus Tectomicrobia bacterium]
MGLVQGGGISDTLRPLLRREGIDQQVGRAHEPRVHGGRSLDGHQFVQQVWSDAATELGEGFRQDKMGLGALDLDLAEATCVHHRHIGAQALTDGFIGRAQLVFEQLQGQQHAGRDWCTASLGTRFGKALRKALCHRVDHGLPWKGLRPEANGMGFRYELGGQEVGTPSSEPVLKVVQDTHGELSL